MADLYCRVSQNGVLFLHRAKGRGYYHLHLSQASVCPMRRGEVAPNASWDKSHGHGGGLAQGGGGLALGGGLARGTGHPLPRDKRTRNTVDERRYASYWNAFLFET